MIFKMDLRGTNETTIKHIIYASYFADANIEDVTLDSEGFLCITHDSDDYELKSKIERIVNRFKENTFAFKENVIFENKIDTNYKFDILSELKEKKIAVELETGVYTYREPFTTLIDFFDYSFVKKIGKHFNAKREYYPVIINTDTLNKTNHFTSFPEHIHFVSHLTEDLDLYDSFVDQVKENEAYDNRIDIHPILNHPVHAINPATCYHCYESMKDAELEADGVVVTAVSKAHRFESKNNRDFGRLLDFTMREIIFVGTPAFVTENRTKSVFMLQELVKDWELSCFIENANDPFFTNDYSIKASFQRNQEMKYELRMEIPFLGRTIAAASSNFHSNTFGKAFNIKAKKRYAATGCLAFGLERFVLAFLSQYGLEESNWPSNIRNEYAEFCTNQ